MRIQLDEMEISRFELFKIAEENGCVQQTKENLRLIEKAEKEGNFTRAGLSFEDEIEDIETATGCVVFLDAARSA